MSQTPSPLGAAPSPPAQGSAVTRAATRAAIAHGARATGIDFDYLMAQARLESGLDPQAEARTSSASGLFQFIESTWLRTLDRHGAAHGLPHLAARIEQRNGRAVVSDPASRAEILRLRHDPAIASVMAGALAQDNRAALLPVLGREPDAAELYLAHFLGAGGASRFLRAMGADPHASAAALLPDAAGANRAIFYEAGRPRSLGEVMGVLRERMVRAMSKDETLDEPGGATFPTLIDPPASAVSPRVGTAWPHSPVGAPPMSRLLQESFAVGEGPADAQRPGPTHVRSAYAKLRALAL